MRLKTIEVGHRSYKYFSLLDELDKITKSYDVKKTEIK